MKTILFFISSNRYACRNRLEGICRYARTRDWHVQAVEWTTGRASVKETLRFRETTGKTILEAINDAVFERACELIRSGVKPSVLAGVVGNVSRSTLERIFRVRAGVSSAEWSKRYFAK